MKYIDGEGSNGAMEESADGDSNTATITSKIRIEAN